MSTDIAADTIAADFLEALFAPGDYILIRPIETWTENGQKKSRGDYKDIEYQLVGLRDQAEQWQPYPQRLASAVKRHNERAEHTRANNPLWRLFSFRWWWQIRSGVADWRGPRALERR
jgi:hypothetical protein